MNIPKKYRQRLPESFNILIQKKRGGGLFGICLDLDIVAESEGNDPDELAAEIFIMCMSHVHNVIKNKLSPDLLDRKAEKEYWDILENYLSDKIQEIKKPRNQPRSVKSKWDIEVYVDKPLSRSKNLVNGFEKLVLQGV